MKQFRKPSLSAERGMTLVEVLVTLGIIALVMGIAAYSLFPSNGTQLRRHASNLAGRVKFLYNDAATKNLYYRIGFDLEEQKYWVESSVDPQFVKKTSADSEKDTTEADESGFEEDEASTSPSENTFAEMGTRVTEPEKLEEGLKIKDIFVYHREGPVETGTEYLYIMPNGWVEPAVINLSDDEENNFYSIEINPYTGKSTIRREYFQPPEEGEEGAIEEES